jgi:hypothetical protein
LSRSVKCARLAVGSCQVSGDWTRVMDRSVTELIFWGKEGTISDLKFTSYNLAAAVEYVMLTICYCRSGLFNTHTHSFSFCPCFVSSQVKYCFYEV